jgi:hypothetical protein
MERFIKINHKFSGEEFVVKTTLTEEEIAELSDKYIDQYDPDGFNICFSVFIEDEVCDSEKLEVLEIEEFDF